MFSPETSDDDDDILRVTQPADPDPAAGCAADLEALSRLVSRIREDVAAFQVALSSFDRGTLDLWLSGAGDEDARTFHLMMDITTKRMLQDLQNAARKEAEKA